MNLLAFVAVMSVAAPVRAETLPGFADLHIHQMAGLGFGGSYYWGRHDGPPEKALPACSGSAFVDGHGFGGGEEGGAGNLKPHARSGWPKFAGWPRWNSTSHQQVHASWLEQAWRSGLRLMLMSAVHNEDVCRILPSFYRKPGATCDDYTNVKAQLAAAKEFEKEHPWYRIAYSPADARRIIGEGKLAVVLAVETSNLFDAGDPIARLGELHAMGVRALQPVHELDNRMGGAAWHAFAIRVLQTLHNLRGLGDRVKAFFSDVKSAVATGDTLATALGQSLRALVNRTAGMELDRHRNNVRGLSEAGKKILREMIRLKMLVDVSHLSRRAIGDALAISAENGHYPLFSSHTNVEDVHGPSDRNEWTYPAELLVRIGETGGVIGLRSAPEDVRTYKRSGVANDCPGSTKSFAQKYAFVASGLGLPTAFAADFNGWALNLRPRFGAEACGARPGADGIARFQAAQGRRTGSELDERGLAHIGLLGDVLRELRSFGVDTRSLDTSADAFVQMWERAQAPARTKVVLAGNLSAAVADLAPFEGVTDKSLVERARELFERGLHSVAYVGCLLEACVTSPLQCARGKGAALDRDLGRCDERHGGILGVKAADKLKFIGCTAKLVVKALNPFGALKLKDVPARARAECAPSK